MGALIFGLCLAAAMALLPLLPLTRLERRIDEASDEDLAFMRQSAESPAQLWFLAGWAAVTAAGAVFLLIRGHTIGLAWLGIAALWVVAIATTRRHRRRLLTVLGDRGRVERTQRYLDRAARSYRWGTVALIGYVAQHVTEYAYPDPRPDGASVAVGICAVAFLLGVVGFIAVRTRMYLSGDDLDKPTGPASPGS